MSSSLKLFFVKRWPLCYLLFCVLGCHTTHEKEPPPSSKTDSLMEAHKAVAAFEQVHQAKFLVESGDLILRTGKDFTSEIMRRLSQKDKTYSHCGISSWENDTLFVYHALGGEWNPDQKLRRDPFELFCNPYENRGFGIFRYRINKAQQKKIIETIHQFYQQGVMFDMQFDLSTNNRMYCTELVYKTMEKSVPGAAGAGITILNHITFVAVDNLFVNSFCHEIKRIVFR